MLFLNKILNNRAFKKVPYGCKSKNSLKQNIQNILYEKYIYTLYKVPENTELSLKL